MSDRAESKGEAVLTVKVIRADGTVEDLGAVPAEIVCTERGSD